MRHVSLSSGSVIKDWWARWCQSGGDAALLALVKKSGSDHWKWFCRILDNDMGLSRSIT
jgi:hypothetical protein